MTGAHSLIRGHDLAPGGEHQGNRVFGHGAITKATIVANTDVAALCCIQVDIAGRPGAEKHDRLEAGAGAQQRLVHGGVIVQGEGAVG